MLHAASVLAAGEVTSSAPAALYASAYNIRRNCLAACLAKSFPTLGPADDVELASGHAGEVMLLMLLL